MPKLISILIDKQDNFEIIRDQIAAILVTESNNQEQLAISAGKESILWSLDVYTERSTPWEKWINVSGNEVPAADAVPIVNVGFDNLTNDKAASNVVKRQKADAVYNVDVYGLGISANDDIGHTPGDYKAALESQRAARLVRNILMSSTYTYLGLQGIVWTRWLDSLTTFRSEPNGRQMERIVGTRLAFGVSFNEFSPQYVPKDLDVLTATVKRADDGKILLVTEFDYTT